MGGSASVIAIGIDCTSGRQAFTYAALDEELRVVKLAEHELDDLVASLDEPDSAAVAVNAPSHVNAGIVRRRAEAAKRGSQSIRGAELREAEHELHGRGISVGGDAAHGGTVPGLGSTRLRALPSARDPSIQAISVRWGPAPMVGNTSPRRFFAFCWVGRPLARPTLEGRLQRALVLYRARCPDPRPHGLPGGDNAPPPAPRPAAHGAASCSTGVGRSAGGVHGLAQRYAPWRRGASWQQARGLHHFARPCATGPVPIHLTSTVKSARVVVRAALIPPT